MRSSGEAGKQIQEDLRREKDNGRVPEDALVCLVQGVDKARAVQLFNQKGGNHLSLLHR